MLTRHPHPFHPALFAATLTLVFIACGPRSDRKVHFGNLQDGAEVESPFHVDMKAENLVVEPATAGVTDDHGHFHIIINSPMPPAPAPIPKDSLHIHYGQGQTETELDLPEGEHTLILQFAKGDHVPYDPQIAQQIQIRVTGRKANPAGAASE